MNTTTTKESRRRRSAHWWLIARSGFCGLEALTADLDGEGEALPIFSLEEEAGMFLWLQAPEAGWEVREATHGELVSVLYGPCAGVERVVPDPLSLTGTSTTMWLPSVHRKVFAEAQVDRRNLAPQGHESCP